MAEELRVWGTRIEAQRCTQAGTRPIIVVSRDSINHNKIGNNRGLLIVGVPTTDAEHLAELYPSHVKLRKGTGGLTKDSVALCEQVGAISVDRLVSYMGGLSPDEMARIENALRIVLMLPRD